MSTSSYSYCLWALVLVCCFSGSVRAAVFGSPDSAEGAEDQRISRQQAQHWPSEFRAVGRLYCEDVLRGLAILIDPAKGGQNQHADGISGVQVDDGSRAPQILTARHLLADMDIESCSFAPESDSWRRSGVLSVSQQGVLSDSPSVVSAYASDWTILNLTPWAGWSRYALQLDETPLEPLSGVAHLVGFDLVTNKMVAHFNCQYGPSEQSRLLRNRPNLYWDNCDSTPGSSGGALFVDIFSEPELELEMAAGNRDIAAKMGQLRLVGMRVGSLFDEIEYGGTPAMGELFDIHKNINVSRAVPLDLFSH